MTFIPLNAPARRDALQLVVTLGPASFGSAAALASAGATAFRLNASHLEPGELARWLTLIRQACPDAPVVVDLQGAKMRIDLANALDVGAGQTLWLTGSPGDGVVVPHPEFFRQLQAGDTVSIDDGRVRMTAERVEAGGAKVRALNAGRLVARKGINVEQHPVRLAGLSARDVEACRAAKAAGATAYAYSFMVDGREAAWLRDETGACTIVGKIERREAIGRIDEIASWVDAVWICRGDLGAQLGLPDLARLVGRLEPARWPVPVLMAGQVFEHLTDHPDPTRSEVCHLYDLVTRGFAGIVLSDETAVGRDPVHATAFVSGLLAALRA